MKPKILIIGLDAATLDLIEPWAREGHLPALTRLMREGASGRLQSTPNMHSASAWTSILTGLNPGRHGLFVFSDRDFATGEQVFFKGGDRAGEIISSHLARNGLTSGLLNVPMTYPATETQGGFMVSGLDAPSLNERAFYPAELRDELLGEFPDYNFTPRGLGDLMRSGHLDEAIAAWVKLTDTQTAAAEYLLKSHPVHFFMTVYTASDWAGHNLWKYHDTTHSEYNVAEAGRFGDAMLTIYRALDEAVERLVALADESAHIYVISDHGMGRHTGASYQVAAWLEDKGYMTRRERGTRASVVGASRRAARKLLPVGMRERIKAGLGEDRVKRIQSSDKDSFYASVDWKHTTAYSEPGRHVININLAGRNLNGIVSQADYGAVCERITEDLGRWTDSRGVRVVERVVRREEAYSQPFVARASDLYIYWNPDARLGEPPAEVKARGFWWSGDHRPEGVLICKGPRVRQGISLKAASVYDVVPTVMHFADQSVPGDLDGQDVREAATDAFLDVHPLEVDSKRAVVSDVSDDLSREEEELMEAKLKSLGYL